MLLWRVTARWVEQNRLKTWVKISWTASITFKID